MFDINSIFIGFVKLLLIAGFIFSFILFCIKLKQDIGEHAELDALGLALWNRRWRAFILIVIFFGMVFVFNLEQVHRPKNNLSNSTAPTTMGYQEPRNITVRVVKKLDSEAAYAKNKDQNKAAKKAFKEMEE